MLARLLHLGRCAVASSIAALACRGDFDAADADASSTDGSTTGDEDDTGTTTHPDIGGDGDGDGDGEVRRVFVTSQVFGANLMQLGGGTDGLLGADNLCTGLANDVGLGGAWRAWVSGPGVDAIDRLVDAGPWYLVDGNTLVFPDKAALATTPLHPIDQFEDGQQSSGGETAVWTGTLVGGTAAAEHCAGWTTIDPGSGGVLGRLDSMGDEWTYQVSTGCDQSPGLRLYCFEQV